MNNLNREVKKDLSNRIEIDDGYRFGIGLFETIYVKNNKPLFLDEHLERLNKSLEYFNVGKTISREEVLKCIENNFDGSLKNHALKIMVSENNISYESRINPYGEKEYEKGFLLGISKVNRSNTSPFVYHKTLNYGECIVEKRKALKLNKNDFIFLNSDKNVCECTSSNIFFVKENKIYTPTIDSGLLPGVVRDFVCRNFTVDEVCIGLEDLNSFDECFVTNSLMGIMPVRAIDDIVFSKREVTKKIMDRYIISILML